LKSSELVTTPRQMMEQGQSVSKVDTIPVLLEDVPEVVELDRRLVHFVPRARIALVAPKDEVFTMTHMGEMNWSSRTGRRKSSVPGRTRKSSSAPPAELCVFHVEHLQRV